MAEQHVEAPEQVVTPGEELWVKIIDIDLERRRISLSIKQAAEGGEVAAEYREFYGEHAYDEHGNYIGPEFEAPRRGRGRARGRGRRGPRRRRPRPPTDGEAPAADERGDPSATPSAGNRVPSRPVIERAVSARPNAGSPRVSSVTAARCCRCDWCRSSWR